MKIYGKRKISNIFFSQNCIKSKIKYTITNENIFRLLNKCDIDKEYLSIIQTWVNKQDCLIDIQFKNTNKSNTICEEGMTILMDSCKKGNYKAVKLLLEHNACPNLLDSNNKSCLDYIPTDKLNIDKINIIKILFEYKFNTNNIPRNSLKKALEKSQYEYAKILLKYQKKISLEEFFELVDKDQCKLIEYVLTRGFTMYLNEIRKYSFHENNYTINYLYYPLDKAKSNTMCVLLIMFGARLYHKKRCYSKHYERLTSEHPWTRKIRYVKKQLIQLNKLLTKNVQDVLTKRIGKDCYNIIHEYNNVTLTENINKILQE